ncbi:unnamed protein product [Oikopleura dioica]|uniref:Uncharacterized protein n=1 Tax=Oikopleura dioica TaxID=34765 RepID=E4Y4M5_OIKDI|nr:unnamed protein product [Oikopleura dioica]
MRLCLGGSKQADCRQGSGGTQTQGSKSEAKTQRLGRLRLEYFQSAKAREAKAGENFVGQG